MSELGLSRARLRSTAVVAVTSVWRVAGGRAEAAQQPISGAPPSTLECGDRSAHASSLVCSLLQTDACAGFTLRVHSHRHLGRSNVFVSRNRRHRCSRRRLDRLHRVDDVSPAAPDATRLDPPHGAIASARRAVPNPASQLVAAATRADTRVAVEHHPPPSTQGWHEAYAVEHGSSNEARTRMPRVARDPFL